MSFFKIIALVIFTLTTSFSGEYESFLKQQKTGFDTYKTSIEDDFKNYKIAHQEAFKEFSQELGKKWPEKKAIVSTQHKWVEYNKNLNTRKSIDFEAQEMSFEVIAKNEAEAKKMIEKMLDETLEQNLKSAYIKDILEQKIAKKLNKPRDTFKSKKKIISDVITKKEKIALKSQIKNKKFIKVKYKNKFIFKANVKLPPKSMIRKAKQFKSDVISNSNKQKIPASVIYAIMHSESSFNPMARSNIPAFGLMQIVPRSAGIDSYKFLYGKKRMLSSSYLYTPNKNITIGSAYLHILYYKYLKKIKDPQSRLYCTIAAYNTGAGNVAKAFIGTTNINRASKKINNMNSDKVYKTLMRNLPYNETKGYLRKVTKRVSSYNKLLKSTL